MSRSSSAHVLIESGEEANTVYNNGYFGLMDCKDEKESFNRRNENVKLVQKNWVPGGDFEVLEEREDEVDWLDDDHEELDKDQDNEVDLTLDDGSSTRRSTNIHWNIHLKMSQCRQNLGRHEALIVFTFIHIGTVLSDFSNVFKSFFHDITPVFTHGSNHKSSSITQIVKNLRLYFLWEFIERWCACKGEYLSVCSKSIFLFCNSAEMYIYANLQKYFTNLQNHLKFD